MSNTSLIAKAAAKTSTALVKTAGIYFLSTLLNQELRASTKTSLETTAQQIRLIRNNYSTEEPV